MLNRMGAQVIGAGTPTIEIVGVDDLMAVDCELIGDRIETGTLLMACGIAGGEITIVGARLEHVEIVASKLGEMGLKVSATPEGIWARADDRMRAVDVATLPFPGFATDFMPIVVALLATAEGTVDRHRERVRQPVRLRGRAQPDGRRHPPRRASCRRPRRRAAVGCAGTGARRAGGRRAGARRARGRRRDRGVRSVSRRSRLLRLRGQARAPWAPRWSGFATSPPDANNRLRAGSPAILAGLGGSMSTDTAIDPAEQNQQVLDAIELIRPALQSDGGDIVFREVDADGIVHVTLVGCVRHLPDLDADAEGRRRADHHGSRAGRHRRHRRLRGVSPRLRSAPRPALRPRRSLTPLGQGDRSALGTSPDRRRERR